MIRHKKIYRILFDPRIPIAVFLSAIALTGSVIWYATSAGMHKKQSSALGIAPLGTEVRADIASMRVESVREDAVGAMPFTPRKGYTFIIPTLTITNLTNEKFYLLPSLTLYIKDSDGNVYNVVMAELNGDGNMFSGPLLPHDKVRQEIAFEVKKGAKGLVLYFEAANTVLTERLEKTVGLFY